MPEVSFRTNYYRRRKDENTWHFCGNCPLWPKAEFEFQKEPGEPLCEFCVALEKRGTCR